MNAIKKLEDQKLTKAPLLLEAKTIDEEVESHYDKLTRFGITNSTTSKIKESVTKVEKQKKEIGKQKAFDLLVEMFAPFNIVTYKTMNEVCNDYDLVIKGLHMYDKVVPEENVEDIDSFINKLAKMDETNLQPIKVNNNKYFTFEDNRRAWGKFVGYYEDILDTSNMFKIAAPIDHFKKGGKQETRIGNEFNDLHEVSPKFVIKPKLAKFPEPQLDPIIYTTVRFLDRIFCIVVTAWDKEADDSRILSKL